MRLGDLHTYQGREETLQENDAYLTLDEKKLVCKIARVVIGEEDQEFSLEVPSLSIESLLCLKNPAYLVLGELRYRQVESSLILWEDNLLTLKTRRIFNEAI